MSERTGWRGILRGVPQSEPHAADNVVRIPGPSWDDIEREIHEATNQIVHWEAEAHRVEIGFNTAIDRLTAARKRLTDRCKNLGARVEFPQSASHLEQDDQ